MIRAYLVFLGRAFVLSFTGGWLFYAWMAFLSILAVAGASIKQVEHDRSFGPADVGTVDVVMVMETRDHQHIQEIRQALRSEGIEFDESGR